MRFAYGGKNIRPAGPAVEMAGGGKRGKPKAGFLTLPTALGNRKKARFPHSHRRDGDIVLSNFKPKEANPAHSSAPPLRDSILVDVSESRMPSLRTSVLTHTKQRRGQMPNPLVPSPIRVSRTELGLGKVLLRRFISRVNLFAGPCQRSNPHSPSLVVRFRSSHVFITGTWLPRSTTISRFSADENLYVHKGSRNIF